VGTRAGLDEQTISSPPGFDPGPSSPVAQSLYRLGYRALKCGSVTNTYRNESYFPLKTWLRTHNPPLEGSDVCTIVL